MPGAAAAGALRALTCRSMVVQRGLLRRSRPPTRFKTECGHGPCGRCAGCDGRIKCMQTRPVGALIQSQRYALVWQTWSGLTCCRDCFVFCLRSCSWGHFMSVQTERSLLSRTSCSHITLTLPGFLSQSWSKILSCCCCLCRRLALTSVFRQLQGTSQLGNKPGVSHA